MNPVEQVEYWNDPAVAGDIVATTSGATKFAKEVNARLAPSSRIVELGCGAGDDAAYFAENGHTVVALDCSRPLMDLAAQRFANLRNLEFRVGDVKEPLAVGGRSWDTVYARFSLHYFDDSTTARIFSEVAWVLRTGGKFFFMARSDEDKLFGQGVELAPAFFDLDGHIRHFFSRQYARELLEEAGFTDIDITAGHDRYHGQQVSWIKAMGTAR